MESAFEWTSSSTTRRYLTPETEITPEIDADEYRMGDNSAEQEIRGVRLVVELTGLLEEQTGNPRNATELLLDMLRGESITFYPDADGAASFPIVPDLSHKQTLFAYNQHLLQGRTLRFKSAKWYDPSDPALDDFADFITIE